MFTINESFAVELDGNITLCSQGEVKALDDLRQIEGDCRVVTDMQGAIARTMSMESDHRYVELMISKKFQETGEFDEPVTVISHWKKKQAKNSTDIFFTALPTSRYHQYLEQVKESRHHLVLLPLHAVLLAILRKTCGNRPEAVVFQHDRFADMIIGTRRKVWYANRVVAFDTTPEQISTLWETIRTDIQSVGMDHRQAVKKIHVVNWLESHPLPEWTDPDAPQLVMADQRSVSFDEQELQVSLPGAMDVTAPGAAVAPTLEKVCYGARRFLPKLNMLLFFLILFCAAGGVWFHHQAVGLRHDLAALHQNILNIKGRVIETYPPVAYKPTMALVTQLYSARNLPGYSQLLREFSEGLGSELQLEILKADYSDDKIKVEAFGTSRAPFDLAYKAYQRTQEKLHRRGYAITEERFDTRISQSEFMIRFDKVIP